MSLISEYDPETDDPGEANEPPWCAAHYRYDCPHFQPDCGKCENGVILRYETSAGGEVLTYCNCQRGTAEWDDYDSRMFDF